jgi:hypothetical protein
VHLNESGISVRYESGDAYFFTYNEITEVNLEHYDSDEWGRRPIPIYKGLSASFTTGGKDYHIPWMTDTYGSDGSPSDAGWFLIQRNNKIKKPGIGAEVYIYIFFGIVSIFFALVFVFLYFRAEKLRRTMHRKPCI